MKAKEWLKKKGIHPTEPIYWDTGKSNIYLDELLDEYAKFTSDNSDYAVQPKASPKLPSFNEVLVRCDFMAEKDLLVVYHVIKKLSNFA